MTQLNCSVRIYEILKENVKQDLKSVKDDSSAKLKEGENTFEMVKANVKVDPDTGKIVQADR
jgi:hypothetical protein